jgi:hypothetical protein
MVRVARLFFVPVQRNAPARRNKIIGGIGQQTANMLAVEFPRQLDGSQQPL